MLILLLVWIQKSKGNNRLLVLEIPVIQMVIVGIKN